MLGHLLTIQDGLQNWYIGKAESCCIFYDIESEIFELAYLKLCFTLNQKFSQLSKEYRMLVSSSIDGQIGIISTSNNKLIQIVKVNSPIYCLTWNARSSQIIVGLKGKIQVYAVQNPEAWGTTAWLSSTTEGSTANTVNNIATLNSSTADLFGTKYVNSAQHTDIVKCLLCVDGKVYSGG